MDSTISYSSCPVCGHSHIQPVLTCRDYTVSQEMFEIWECSNCQLRFTQNAPSPEKIGAYYQSENYISHSDTDEGLINKLYKVARRFTLSLKAKLVNRFTGKTSGSLLDIGSGTGAFLHTMKTGGWQVTGLEPDASARQKAFELYGIRLHDSKDLFTLEEKFNAITLWHVLEHVHDLHGYFEQFRQKLAEEGRLFIAVPNYKSHDAAHYGANWAAYDVPRHLYHFSSTAMEKLAALHGFKIISRKPMLFDPFYIAMLSEQYKNGKGNLPAAFWHGGRNNLGAAGDTKKASSIIYVMEVVR